MRIVIFALVLICVNLSANLIIAGNIFCEADDTTCEKTLPIYTDEVKDEMPDTYDKLENPPTTLSPVDLVATIFWSGVNFIAVIISAPTAFGALIGYAIPGNTAIEVLFVTGLMAAMWFIYILAILQVIRGFTME